MSKIDPSWAQSLRNNPDAEVHAIVRTEDVDAVAAFDWGSHGLTLRHTYKLVPGAAVTGSASAVLAIADEPWVVRVEPDREVRTMS